MAETEFQNVKDYGSFPNDCEVTVPSCRAKSKRICFHKFQDCANVFARQDLHQVKRLLLQEPRLGEVHDR